MTILAQLTETTEGYEGLFECLSSPSSPIRLVRVADRTHDRIPDYRVFRGASEVGAGWIQARRGGGTFVAVTLDDPSYAAPIQCRLVRGQDGYQLIWSR